MQPLALARPRASQHDAAAGTAIARLPVDEVRRLSHQDPAIVACHIAAEWAQLITAAWLCWTFFHPVLYVLCVAFIGGRQQALLLLVHEGAHRRLFARPWLNEWLSECLLAWPFLFVTMRQFRTHHLLHHRRMNTPRDPDWVRKQSRDWVFPQPWIRFVGSLALQISGLGFFKLLYEVRALPAIEGLDAKPPGRALRWGRVAFIGAYLGTVTLLGLWPQFLLFWIVPMLTWLQLALHIRSLGEHFPLPALRTALAQTRTTVPTWLDRMFVGTKDSCYHLEHHLYPSVPFYRLAELHRTLMRDAAYARRAHVTRSYWGVLRECAGFRSETAPEQDTAASIQRSTSIA